MKINNVIPIISAETDYFGRNRFFSSPDYWLRLKWGNSHIIRTPHSGIAHVCKAQWALPIPLFHEFFCNVAPGQATVAATSLIVLGAASYVEYGGHTAL